MVSDLHLLRMAMNLPLDNSSVLTTESYMPYPTHLLGVPVCALHHGPPVSSLADDGFWVFKTNLSCDTQYLTKVFNPIRGKEQGF
jgi:hypothetical protein